MTPKLPESSFIHPPHIIEGTPKEARASFYEFAKDKIKYLDNEEFKEWQINRREPNFLATALFNMTYHKNDKNDDFKKWISNLEITINKDAFYINGKDYSDIIPFILEHEIYEAWLYGKKGTGPNLDNNKQHLLARRKEYLLAEQAGLGDRLFKYHTMTDDSRNAEEHEYALKVAKKQVGHLKKKN